MPRILTLTATCAVLIASTSSAQGGSSIPQGFANAAPAVELLSAWTGKSLWIPNSPETGGGTCFDFHEWENCQIFEFDSEMRMGGESGGSCQVKEYVVVDGADLQPGDYGLVVEGVGTSFNYGFLEVIWPTYMTFTPRNGDGPWEISEEACSTREKDF